jgi:Flp pilus assembly protein TadG
MARRANRRGIIVVLAAVLLVVMLGMIAFAVDVGFITVARTELQGASDAAALAGVSKLPLGESEASAVAKDYVGRNIATNKPPKITTTAGQWDLKSRSFKPGRSPFDALQVRVESTNQALFFGRVLNTNTFNAGASATAIVRPRDIMLVLDYSGSMHAKGKIDQLKGAVALFLDVLDDYSTSDRVGFVRYSTDATLESGLTFNLNKVNSEVQSAKAAGWTNIGDAMSLGIKELKSRGRDNATNLMVVMTDGLANRPDNRDPRQYSIDQARIADKAGIDVMSISFGDDADKTLMQQIAEICRDPHFAVDARSVSECEKELREVFLKIAENFKIKLVQ